MFVERFRAWLLDKCPGFVIPACLVLCHHREEAGKHLGAALGKVNLQTEQGEHRGSKIEVWTHFDRFTGTLGPAFPPLLVLQPLLPHSPNQTQSCAWGNVPSGRYWSQQDPLCSCSLGTVNFTFKTSEKAEKFGFLPNLYFLFSAEPSVFRTEASQPHLGSQCCLQHKGAAPERNVAAFQCCQWSLRWQE